MNLDAIKISNTLGIDRSVEAVYQPKSIQELVENYMRLKQEHEKIWVVSKGHNWGYGCAAPVRSGGLLIDLQLCREIRNFDPEHGIITVEPGVTYGDLEKFLQQHGPDWLTPVHGGGPTCSVLGNILERGYGITPHADHFAALTHLKAILASGEIYQGTLSEIGVPRLDRLFKYGIGPYYDGIFTQSGLGIVTEVTLRLAPRTERCEMFYFNALNEADLPLLVSAIKKTKRELGSAVGGMNLINRERVLTMGISYPEDKIKKRLPLDAEDLHKFSRSLAVTPWLIVGMLYGTNEVTRAAKKRLLKNFSHVKMRKFFYSSAKRPLFQILMKTLEFLKFNSLVTLLEKVDLAFQTLNGHPNSVALKLAYWKNQTQPLNSGELNPSEDQCGLIWYAPLVEMKDDVVRQYVQFIQEASEKFQFNSIITLTTIDDLCFDSTIPILFNKSDPEDQRRAQEFYQYLLQEGLKRGFFPYRLNVESQSAFDFQSKKFVFNLAIQGRYA
jgi:4-cresol dehydrogenase (hydroxylating) flavoprotein subunit